MHNFNQKVAIVTGAGSGIGKQIARQLCLANARVVINDLDRRRVDDAASELGKLGGQVTAVAGDSSELAVIDQLVATADSRYGKLDFAIANAGITTFGRFLDYPPETFQQLVDTNLRGSFYLAQRTARKLIAQNQLVENVAPGGRILLMSSVTGLQYHPDLTAYAMSKAAIQMLAKSLGAELAPHGIGVNAIAPGATVTERTLQESSYESQWAALTPTGRPSTVQDIADAALFLLSDAAAQITGQTLVVDGGWTAVSPPPRQPD